MRVITWFLVTHILLSKFDITQVQNTWHDAKTEIHVIASKSKVGPAVQKNL